MKHSQSKLMPFIVSEWWKLMLYYISFYPEGENKECVEIYGKYIFLISWKRLLQLLQIPAGDVILIYTQRYRLNIHYGSVIVYDVL